MLSILLGKYQKENRRSQILMFWVTNKLFIIETVAFQLFIKRIHKFQSTYILGVLLLTFLFFFLILVIPVSVSSYCDFDLISLMISDTEHLFTCLLSLCLFSFENVYQGNYKFLLLFYLLLLNTKLSII